MFFKYKSEYMQLGTKWKFKAKGLNFEKSTRLSKHTQRN